MIAREWRRGFSRGGTPRTPCLSNPIFQATAPPQKRTAFRGGQVAIFIDPRSVTQRGAYAPSPWSVASARLSVHPFIRSSLHPRERSVPQHSNAAERTVITAQPGIQPSSDHVAHDSDPAKSPNAALECWAKSATYPNQSLCLCVPLFPG